MFIDGYGMSGQVYIGFHYENIALKITLKTRVMLKIEIKEYEWKFSMVF